MGFCPAELPSLEVCTPGVTSLGVVVTEDSGSPVLVDNAEGLDESAVLVDDAKELDERVLVDDREVLDLLV